MKACGNGNVVGSGGGGDGGDLCKKAFSERSVKMWNLPKNVGKVLKESEG